MQILTPGVVIMENFVHQIYHRATMYLQRVSICKRAPKKLIWLN